MPTSRQSSYLVITLLLLIFAPAFAANTQPTEKKYYVAPNGRDDNPGTKNKPFATLTHARDVIRNNKNQHPAQSVKVILKKGQYFITEPIVFEPADSGSDQAPVTYTAEKENKAIIHGGINIKNWSRIDGNRWSASIPKDQCDQIRYPQLFCDGVRLPLARFPNNTLLTIIQISDDLKQITFDQSLPTLTSPAKQAQLVVLQNWSLSRVPVETLSDKSLTTAQPAGYVGHYECRAKVDRKAFLEGDAAFLDQLGEWLLDKNSGVITYFAAPDENPNKHTFILPLADQLLIIRGTSDQPVKNIRFEGITFSYTDWDFPDFGYRGIQAGYHGTEDAIDKPIFTLPVAVEMAYAQNCSLNHCQFTHTGASAIGIGAGCRDNTIAHGDFSDIGGNGIHISYRHGPLFDLHNLDWPSPADVPQNNSVTDCTLTHCGAICYGAVGIFTAFAQNTRIAHNLIYNMPYTAISSGFVWGDRPTSHNGTIIEYNHIHHVMQQLTDGGGIYTLGLQPGAVMRANLIHDLPKQVLPYGAPSNGFFIDQGTTAIHFEDNIVYNIGDEPVRFNITEKEKQSWGKNYFSVTPDQSDFPKKLAKKIGPRK